MPPKSKFNPVCGDRFGRLLVTKFHSKNGRLRLFECKCDCGNIALVNAQNLKRGSTKSCGCLRVEHSRIAHTKHGYSRTKEYHAWSDMRARCLDIRSDRYKNYGGRGITICDRWINNFENFLEDMGKKPSLQHSLDRINVDGNYEPSNCRWATSYEQRYNKKNTVYLTHDGVTLCLGDWAKLMNIKAKTLYYRNKLNLRLRIDEIPKEKISEFLNR